MSLLYTTIVVQIIEFGCFSQSTFIAVVLGEIQIEVFRYSINEFTGAE